MISAKFYFDEAEAIRAFAFSGHAGYADHGSDIVCAAVSAIGQTVIGTLDELLLDMPKYEIDPRSGLISCEIRDYDRYTEKEKMAIATLMFSCLVGVKQLLPNYGEYIEIEKLGYSEGEYVKS